MTLQLSKFIDPVTGRSLHDYIRNIPQKHAAVQTYHAIENILITNIRDNFPCWCVTLCLRGGISTVILMVQPEKELDTGKAENFISLVEQMSEKSL